ncbi:alkaline phosphatase [Siculibacillus lacustris]|uniref:Alkaline phosphatase n=1 Tax=Siculibacillus lacustris TaxID=1549641 RepID=A0A4Q9VPG9_9HYPH|nr:alkaline phosphatase [Siculibacillus lacustris]TBW37367.1 alkaline phosphatase [Siculibacillus lacustris]
MLPRSALLAATLSAGLAAAAQAQTIYPLNRAEILAGSKFDFKVEFPGAPAAAHLEVTIDGKDAAEVFGAKPTVIEKEDGNDLTAYWLRDVSLAKPGTVKIEATAGDKKKAVAWEVFDTPKGRVAKNVILFIGDGFSVAHRTAARIMSKGMVEGRYGGEFAIDDMPHMALISTAGTDSIVTDSANSMSAYTTGHKSCVNALGVYCAKNKNTLEHPKVETIGELVKRRTGMAVGVVTNSEIEDATPAGVVSHTRKRSDYNDIVKMFWDVKPDVIMGGGSPFFLAKSTPGSKRPDDVDYIKQFESAGYSFVSTKTEMNKAVADGKTKILGLYNTGNVDGALDLRLLKKGTVSKFPDQPDVTEETKAAIEALSKNKDGFFLMVESARIDKYSHSMDPERALFDVIMLDNAVKVAKDFAAKADDTMIIVVADHAHAVSIIGTYDDDRPGQTPREKLGTYADAKVPVYDVDAEGYPKSVDVSKRIAVAFGSSPDTCFNSKPYLEGENVPAVAGATKDTYVENPKNCERPGAVHITGNLPFDANQAVHAGDDVVLTAMGPGSEVFHGRLDNTRVFRAMATALGLAK